MVGNLSKETETMCKYCNPILKTNAGANFSHPYYDPRCVLKDSDEMTRDEIYGSLFKLGLSGSIVNGNCPLFQNKTWVKCPWYEQA